MKKVFLSALLLYVSCFSYAQLNLLHIFNQDYMVGMYQTDTYGLSFEQIIEPVDAYVYMTVDSSAITPVHKLIIVNSNFNVVKEVILPINYSDYSFTEYQVSAIPILLGKHCVNTDNKIEFMIRITYYSFDYSSIHINSYIINEDGDIIYDFGLDKYEMALNIHKVGNQLRLTTLSENENGHDCYRIYSLGGSYNPNSMTIYTQSNNMLNPYPNPTRNVISLPYQLEIGETAQMQIFNINGQLIDSFTINSESDIFQLNVSRYSRGTYIYTYNGISRKFIVQ